MYDLEEALSFSNGSVCRTAPATPGLFIIYLTLNLTAIFQSVCVTYPVVSASITYKKTQSFL